MSANTAINIFVRTVIRTRSIPFAIKAGREEDVREEAKAAFQRMCDTAKENNIEMSLDEINAEIKAARQERRRNNGLCSN